MKSISDLDLQRLVDGELSVENQQELLKACDAMPEQQGWRRIALAFLENQIWGSCLHEFSAHSMPVENDEVSIARQPGIRRAVMWPWFSIAAGLLVGLLSGWTILQLAPKIPTSQIAVANAPTTNPEVATQPRLELGGMEPLMAVDVKGADGQLRQIPVFHPDAAPGLPMFSGQSQLSPEFIRQLESRGYTFDRQRLYYRLPLDDGREVIIPSDRFQLRQAVQ